VNAQLLTTRKQRIRRLAMVACGAWTGVLGWLQ
jgi:hypothetical protein